MCKIHKKKEGINWEAREKEFRKIMEKYKALAKEQGNPYDCLVPFSGGKDSVYTLYVLVKKYGMKPLVVTFSHMFSTDIIKENQSIVFEKLGVDHIILSPNWQTVKKLCVKALKRTGDFCWHCHCGVYAFPVQIAVAYKIPLLVWGSADYSSDEKEDRIRDWKYFTRYVDLGLSINDMVGGGVTLRDLAPYTYPPVQELKELNIIGVNQGQYFHWNAKKQSDMIKKELGWKGAKVEGSFVDYDNIECRFVGIRDYIKFIRRKVGRTAQLASVYVRNGLITRKKALELAEKYDGKRPASLDKFLKEMGMTEKEFNKFALKHKVFRS